MMLLEPTQADHHWVAVILGFVAVQIPRQELVVASSVRPHEKRLSVACQCQ